MWPTKGRMLLGHMILKQSTVPLPYKADAYPRSLGSYSRMLGEYAHDKKRISLMTVALTDNSLSNVIFMVQYYHEMQKRFRRSVARPSCASGYAPASG